MSALTREERETAILLNDKGEITVWSVSPMYQNRLKRRLGPPALIDGECHYWHVSLETHSVVLPSKKRPRSEKRLEADRQNALRMRETPSHRRFQPSITTGTGQDKGQPPIPRKSPKKSP